MSIVFGVPYGKVIAFERACPIIECPICGAHIREIRQEKDRELFTLTNYSDHVKHEHPERVVTIGQLLSSLLPSE